MKFKQLERAAALVSRVLHSPQARQLMAGASVYPFSMSSEQLAQFQQADAVKRRAVAAAAGAQPE